MQNPKDKYTLPSTQMKGIKVSDISPELIIADFILYKSLKFYLG